MSTSGESSGTADHVWAAEVLFEYVNGSLPRSRVERLEAHLEACHQCRRDLAFERELAGMMQERKLTEYLPTRSLDALNRRIDGCEDVRGQPTRFSRDFAAVRRPKFARWLLIAQAATIAVLAISLYRVANGPEPQIGYRTLSSAATEPLTDGHLQVVFADEFDLAGLRSLLVSLDASIVSGPTVDGMLVIEISSDSELTADEAVAKLRADANVVFVTRLLR